MIIKIDYGKTGIIEKMKISWPFTIDKIDFLRKKHLIAHDCIYSVSRGAGNQNLIIKKFHGNMIEYKY